MTSKLTRERIELIANFHRAMTLPPSHDEIEELARMALAAMDSEPVAWVSQSNLDALSRGHDALVKSTDNVVQPVPLYRHAQPAPVGPDENTLRIQGIEALEEFLTATTPEPEMVGGIKLTLTCCRVLKAIIKNNGWADFNGGKPEKVKAETIITALREPHSDACRAAMLQAQSEGDDDEPTDDERIMAIEGIHNCERCGDEGWVVGEMGITRCACNQDKPVFKIDHNSDFIKHVKAVSGKVRAGNSPVIPDGYVLVPREPTEEMNKAGWASMNEHDAINPTYRAMIAAAPHETPALNSVQSVVAVLDTWIPVSERMPGRYYVLAADFSGRYYPPSQPNTQVGIYDDWFGDGKPTWDDGDGNDLHLKQVTHWMPLPAAPQEVK